MLKINITQRHFFVKKNLKEILRNRYLQKFAYFVFISLAKFCIVRFFPQNISSRKKAKLQNTKKIQQKFREIFFFSHTRFNIVVRDLILWIVLNSWTTCRRLNWFYFVLSRKLYFNLILVVKLILLFINSDPSHHKVLLSVQWKVNYRKNCQ